MSETMAKLLGYSVAAMLVSAGIALIVGSFLRGVGEAEGEWSRRLREAADERRRPIR